MMMQVAVVGATNRPNDLDPALRRAGRFDRELSLAPPSSRERQKILGTFLAKMGERAGEVDVKALADRCVGYVGADLEALCRRAALGALRAHLGAGRGPGGSGGGGGGGGGRVTMAHFDSAMEAVTARTHA